MSTKSVQLDQYKVIPITWEEDLNRILNTSNVNEVIEQEPNPIIRPFLAEFWRTLQEALINVNTDIVDNSQVEQGLMQACKQRLASLQYKTTMLEMSIASRLGDLTAESPNERYQEYFQLLEDSHNLRVLFDTYPVLARCLTEHTLMFSSYVREIIDHYNSDWMKFNSNLGNNGEYDCLTGIEVGAGDTHNSGKSVAILKFNSGAKLVYKPHSLRIDECYSTMIDWINQRGIKYLLSSPNTLNCGTYGYHEFISHNPCQSIMEVEQFYYRLGALTALCYASGATDYHSENIIASGAQPVLIDLETIFTPLTETQLQHMLGEKNLRTVFSSLMLPGVYSPNPLMDIDISAVGGRAGQKSQLMKIQRITNIGTDEACLIDDDFYTTDEKQNRPLLNGEYMDVSMYTKQTFEGFCDLYRLILMHRDTFVHDILLPYSDATGRHVLRATNLYGKLLSHSMHPDYLQNESDRNRLLHIMVSESTFPPQAVIEHELEQMQRQDVPYFMFSLNSHDLYDMNGVCIRDFYPMSVIELVEHYLLQLSEEDLSTQLQYLRWSLSSLENSDHHSDGHSYSQRSDMYNRHTTVLTQDLVDNENRITQFQQCATSIGNSIMRRIVTTNDNNMCIGFTIVGEENKHKPVWLEHNMYSGLSGYVLYLAQLTNITCDQQYREMAQQLLNTMQSNKLKLDEASELHKEIPISTSAFLGEGTHIYALIYCGLLWKDDTLLENAKNRLPVLMRAIEQETQYDIIAGLAGFIIVMLRAYEALHDIAYLHVAQAAGDRLYTLMEKLSFDTDSTIDPDEMTNQRVNDNHSTTNSNILLTGLSHGAAGLAWAFTWLARLSYHHSKHSSDQYLIMANRLLTYENNYYSEIEQNWRDLRFTDTHKFADFWCHGAPGIALARAEIIRHLEAINLLQAQEWEFVTHDYKNALQTLLNHGNKYNSFCLCHGTLGNADILLHLSKLMNDPNLANIANNWAIEAFVDYESYKSSDRLIASFECDGLMTGTVGMGYEYLRLLDNEVPSILVFELPRSL